MPSLDTLSDINVADLLEEAPAEGGVELGFAAEEEEGEGAFDVLHGGFHRAWFVGCMYLGDVRIMYLEKQ